MACRSLLGGSPCCFGLAAGWPACPPGAAPSAPPQQGREPRTMQGIASNNNTPVILASLESSMVFTTPSTSAATGAETRPAGTCPAAQSPAALLVAVTRTTGTFAAAVAWESTAASAPADRGAA